MAKLTEKKRDSMADSKFGLPEEHKYPMPDESHARNAKARASQQDTQSPLVVGHGEVGDAVAIEISHHRRPGRRAAASQS